MAKHLYPIMRDDITRLGSYWEPFVGGAGMMSYVGRHAPEHVTLVGSDNHKYVVALLDAVARGWVPPTTVTKDEYRAIKDNRDQYPDHLVGFVGFACCFSGCWFAGYAPDRPQQRYAECGSNTLVRDGKWLRRVELKAANYDDPAVVPLSPAVIYCDPPYAETTKYSTGHFDQTAFHDWARVMADAGHKVYVSGFNCPTGFRVVWRRDRVQQIRKGGECPVVTELLYVPDLKTT